ncbi:methylglyoxal synthase [Aquibium oceanicum]|uniref:Methylglyoxal synthase n=1 Tax=Aquibium oceanicum TaxID=1670800 RepID=A0A1L3SMC6_9HYPH|nr:methylglyoxal synthase [Aquibium oceanicum]APH70558.1 methylglyoxal synthase [Aquibium oceanicum]
MPNKLCLALIAHDQKKDDIVSFVRSHADFLEGCTIYATGTTGGRIQEACPALDVTRMKSGPLGGDQQIGALIAEGRIDALIFFVDPLTPMPHDVDVKALMRLAIVHDIPMALNSATAEIVVDRMGVVAGHERYLSAARG